jgi:hypothetical protein
MVPTNLKKQHIKKEKMECQLSVLFVGELVSCLFFKNISVILRSVNFFFFLPQEASKKIEDEFPWIYSYYYP